MARIKRLNLSSFLSGFLRNQNSEVKTMNTLTLLNAAHCFRMNEFLKEIGLSEYEYCSSSSTSYKDGITDIKNEIYIYIDEDLDEEHTENLKQIFTELLEKYFKEVLKVEAEDLNIEYNEERKRLALVS